MSEPRRRLWSQQRIESCGVLTRSAWQAPNSSVDESWRFGILACGRGDDSHWVRDSEAFLSGPLFLAGVFLRHGDLFVASVCAVVRVGRWPRLQPVPDRSVLLATRCSNR